MFEVMYVIITILFWFMFIVSCSLIFPVALIIRVLTIWDAKRNISHQFSAYWARIYLLINPFWKVKLIDLNKANKNKTYVIVSNHNSLIDILVLFRTHLNFKWVAKDVLFKAPILGWNMWLCGYIPIRRGDEKSRKELFLTCKMWLQRGVSVLLFPEGTRSRTGELGILKPGAFKLAVEENISILPIVLTGTRDALPAKSIFFSHKANMTIRVLDEIDTKNILEGVQNEKVEQLMNITRQKIQAALAP